MDSNDYSVGCILAGFRRYEFGLSAKLNFLCLCIYHGGRKELYMFEAMMTQASLSADTLAHLTSMTIMQQKEFQEVIGGKREKPCNLAAREETSALI